MPAAARPSSRRPARFALIALMAAGSALMWIGLPLGLVYLASQVAGSPQPSLGPYLIVIIGLPLGMALVGKGLAKLDRLYGRITGTLPTRPERPSWLKSMRGERGSTRRRTVLDVVMIWSVSLCVLALAIWFFFLAGSSLPRL